MRIYLKMLSVALIFVSFYGCGSSGGGGGQPALETPITNISGTFKITETMGSNNCDEPSGARDIYNLKVVQNGNNLTVTNSVGDVFKGTISGNAVSWTGSFPDDGGTTTITEMSVTVSTTGNSLNGTTNWTWTDGSFGCQGSTSISGTMIKSASPDGNTNTDSGINKFLYKGFDDINLFVGGFWEYSHESKDKTNQDPETITQGVVRIELIDSVDVNFGQLGSVTLYKTQYTTLSGDAPKVSLSPHEYFAAKDGVLYIGTRLANGPGEFKLVTLFDSRDGKVYTRGFYGFFSSERKEAVSLSRINNQFISAMAVLVNEPFLKPNCERIAGVQVCDETFHNYQVREYYLPHIGFGGFHRAGTSVFSGGGFVDIFKSTFNMGLINTNIGPMPPIKG